MGVQLEVQNVHRTLPRFLSTPSQDEPNSIFPTSLLYTVHKIAILVHFEALYLKREDLRVRSKLKIEIFYTTTFLDFLTKKVSTYKIRKLSATIGVQHIS